MMMFRKRMPLLASRPIAIGRTDTALGDRQEFIPNHSVSAPTYFGVPAADLRSDCLQGLQVFRSCRLEIRRPAPAGVFR